MDKPVKSTRERVTPTTMYKPLSLDSSINNCSDKILATNNKETKMGEIHAIKTSLIIMDVFYVVQFCCCLLLPPSEIKIIKLVKA